MTFTVLTAEFSHESNTFSRCPADYAAFEDRGVAEGEVAIAARGQANTPLAGFLDVGRPAGWRIVHAISAAAQPSGPVTRDAFDRIAGTIVAAAKAHAGQIDGVLLGLHGAMVTEFCEDGEGELLARLRAVLGPAIPIGVTLDPHANVTRRMTELAQIVVSYKTYPHVDIRETGRLAAGILQRTMAGEIHPATLRADRPMLEEVNGGRTDIGPMVERIARARAYEREPDVFAVSVNGGFGNADIAEVGPTVLVTGEGDVARHRAFAEELVDDMWARRFEAVTDFLSVEQAVAEARSYVAASGPLIIADYADNPGGGGYGDATRLLAAMIEADLDDACFGPIVDPEVAAELQGAAPGATVSVRLGGKVDPKSAAGPPAHRHAAARQRRRLCRRRPDDGRAARELGPLRRPARRRDRDPRHHHPRPDERPPAVPRLRHRPGRQARGRAEVDAAFPRRLRAHRGKVVVCDSGALCTPDLTKLPYRHVRRPIFPLDR